MLINENIKREIWEKASIVENYNPEKIRKDACGAWICYDDFDNLNSSFGWEIDHICPKPFLFEHAKFPEFSDNMLNLRPLHWKNIASKNDDYPTYISLVTAVDDKNKIIESVVDINVEIQRDLQNLFDFDFLE